MNDKSPSIEETEFSREGSQKKKQITIGLFITAITILITIGGIELVGYIWETRTAQGSLGWTLVASRRMPLVKKGSPNQSYFVLQPNEDYLWEGIPVHVNSRGFRSEEFENSKPANTYRILNLGDSVVFGWEVHQSDTYGKQLEQKLNELDDGVYYEVINAGVPAWTLEAERNFLLQEGFNYQPDLVILDLTIVNDIYSVDPTDEEIPTLLQWLRDNTYGWSFLTTQVRFMLSGIRGPEAIPVLNPSKKAENYFPLTEDDPVWDEIWNYINDINKASQERGIDFAVIAFPTAYQLNSAKHTDLPQQILGRRAIDEGIDFIDLLPVYREICDSVGNGACEGYKNLLFADVWMHPNPMGHQLAADEIMKKLELIPSQ